MSSSITLSSCSHPRSPCPQCGSQSIFTLKSSRFNLPAQIPFAKHLKSLRKHAAKPTLDGKQINSQTLQLLQSICQKFTFKEQTLALGMYLFEQVWRMHEGEKFWASACLILAGKAIQLDKNVPYLSRYQRYADKSYPQQEYETAERHIFEALNFTLQYSTFMTFINFYMVCGVLHSSDSLSTPLVGYFEDDLIAKASEVLKEGGWWREKQEIVALKIIIETRRKYGLKGWTKQLEEMTGHTEDQIHGISSNSNASSSVTPLKESIKHNNQNITINHPKPSPYDTISSTLKQQPLLRKIPYSHIEKYTSISKPMKENASISYSISKPANIAPTTKSRSNLPLTHLSIVDHYASMSLNSAELLNRRK